MRRLVGLVILSLVGFALVACASAASGPKIEPGKAVGSYSGGPRLALGQRSVDYGKVEFNQQVKASFDVKNVGDRPLTIRKVDVETVEGC
jgi:hypothetical protein